MEVGTRVMVPTVVFLVHSGDDSIRGGIRCWGKASSAASTRVVGGRHTGDHTAMEIAVSPVASLEISWHGKEGMELSMRSLLYGVVSFIHHSSFHSSLFLIGSYCPDMTHGPLLYY